MDVMLNTLKDADFSCYDSDTVIKATCLVSIQLANFYGCFYNILHLINHLGLCAIKLPTKGR